MKVQGFRSLLPFLLATALAACGPGGDESPSVSAGELETNTAAVISGATRGSTVQVNGTDGVNIRSGPGTTYGIVASGAYLKTATVLNGTPTNGYYQVDYQGTVGWTHGDYWNVVAGLWVNGHQLTTYQDKWVRWMAQYTVPKLVGTRDTRLTKASRVAWWSLKEGVLDLSNPFPYSNCNYTTGDARIGPLETCPSGRAWQVGISGVQVPNFTMSTVQNTSASIHSTLTEAQVLGATASQAGYASGTATYNSIVNSTGDLRKSWLMRNHAVGVTLEEQTVTYECVTNAFSWCYSSAWYPSSYYAPDRTEALESMRELKAIMNGLAP